MNKKKRKREKKRHKKKDKAFQRLVISIKLHKLFIKDRLIHLLTGD